MDHARIQFIRMPAYRFEELYRDLFRAHVINRHHGRKNLMKIEKQLMEDVLQVSKMGTIRRIAIETAVHMTLRRTGTLNRHTARAAPPSH